MGGVCSLHADDKKCIHNYIQKTHMEITTLKTVARIVLLLLLLLLVVVAAAGVGVIIYRKSTKYSVWEITSHVPYILTTEQLQHFYTPETWFFSGI